MKTITLEQIRSYGPCYDPNKYLPETWTGTVVDLLKLDSVPVQDRLWVALRTDLVSERVMRLFAVWSYRQTLAFIPNPDPRSIAAADTAERFANNEATQEQLNEARLAADSAVHSAADSAARLAAYSAADSAARLAASAARSAAYSAASAARSAAYSAARSAQILKLIEMIEKENS